VNGGSNHQRIFETQSSLVFIETPGVEFGNTNEEMRSTEQYNGGSICNPLMALKNSTGNTT